MEATKYYILFGLIVTLFIIQILKKSKEHDDGLTPTERLSERDLRYLVLNYKSIGPKVLAEVYMIPQEEVTRLFEENENAPPDKKIVSQIPDSHYSNPEEYIIKE